MKTPQRSPILYIFLVLIVLAALVAYFSLNREPLPAASSIPEPAQQSSARQAPDFSVVNAAGETLSFSQWKGKPVVLNFWASWCPPCREEMPDFHKAYLANKDDVAFVMVNMTDGRRETLQKAQQFVDGQQFTFPVYFDTERSAARAYGLASLPTTVFVDRHGNVARRVVGAVDSEALQQGIALIRNIP